MPGVGKDTAVERAEGKYVLSIVAREISAVFKQKLKVREVLSRVHARNQFVVLFRSGLKAEGINAALIGRAHQLRPSSPDQAALGQIPAQIKQVAFAIASPQASHLIATDMGGNLRLILD